MAEQGADSHNDGKDDEIPQTAQTMAENTGDHHKYTAAQCQTRQHKTAQNGLILFLAHPSDEDGQIHQIDGDDGQFGGVEDKGARPCLGQIGEKKVAKPPSDEQQTDDGGIIGHIGFFVQTAVDVGLRSFAADRHGVHTATAGQHQAVDGSETGNSNKEFQDSAQRTAENVGEGDGGALVNEVLIGSTACHTDVVENIHGGDDDAADDQGAGQILFGILDLRIDGGGDDPPLVGKGGGAHRGKEGALGGGGGHHGVGAEVFGQHPVGQTVDDAHHRHQP